MNLTMIDDLFLWGKLIHFLYCFRKWKKFWWIFLYTRCSLWSFYFHLVRFVFNNIVSLMMVLRVEHAFDGKLLAYVEVLSIETLTLRLTGYRLMSRMSKLHYPLWRLVSFLVQTFYLQEDLQLKSKWHVINRL